MGRSAVERVRRKEPFHALHVSGRRAVADIHVTATNPLCAGRHPYLVTHTVIADCRAGGVRTVEVIIAREGRIVPAGIADAVMNGVVPIVIVIGSDSVPAAVVRLERIMRPPLARIGAGHYNILARESKRPHVRRVRVSYSWFDYRRRLRLRRRFFDSARLRQVIVDTRIAFHSRHIPPGRQCLGDLAGSLH